MPGQFFQRYRDQLLTFNDDIQVTAAVVLGAVLGAVTVTGKSLKEQQIVMLGAGGSGNRGRRCLRTGMIQEALRASSSLSLRWIIPVRRPSATPIPAHLPRA